jgi:hypothetical protein
MTTVLEYTAIAVAVASAIAAGWAAFLAVFRARLWLCYWQGSWQRVTEVKKAFAQLARRSTRRPSSSARRKTRRLPICRLLSLP